MMDWTFPVKTDVYDLPIIIIMYTVTLVTKLVC